MAQKAPELSTAHIRCLVRGGTLPPPLINGTRPKIWRVTHIAYPLQGDPATNNINNK